MVCGLNEVFGELTDDVPDGPPGEPEFIFERPTLPSPPEELRTDLVILRKTTHEYNSWYRADVIDIHISRTTARQLGVFLFACLFHGPQRTTTLILEHPESQIRRIVFPEREQTLVGLDLVPRSFCYFPDRTQKHPWWDVSNVHDLPLFALTNAEDCTTNDQEWMDRDTIRIESSATGTARLAELLLNAGCSWNDQSEYDLEGETGFRGVAPLSAEVRIFLPGSLGWLCGPQPGA